VATAANDKTRTTIKQAHDKFGHCNEDATRKIAKQLGWELIPGSLGMCEACTIGKAKPKNVPKLSKGKPVKSGENRIYLDISTVKPKKGHPKLLKPNWRIMVDERTQLKFSNFFKTKNRMVEPTCEQFQKWKENGKAVTYLPRLDNTGENKLLEKRCESSDWKFNIKFEFTARDKQEQNSLAEVGFAMIANQGQVMMARANVPMKVSYQIYSEAFKMATLLDGLVPIEIDGVMVTRYVHWCGKNPEFAKHLRMWGEVGTVTVKSKMTPKVKDRGVQCIFVGYALNHPGDTY
jgi:hypothetical protein